MSKVTLSARASTALWKILGGLESNIDWNDNNATLKRFLAWVVNGGDLMKVGQCGVLTRAELRKWANLPPEPCRPRCPRCGQALRKAKVARV